MSAGAAVYPSAPAAARVIGPRRCILAHPAGESLSAETVIRTSVRCTALSRDQSPHQACGCQPLGAWHCALGFRDCLPVLLDGDACLAHFNRFLELQGHLLETQDADASPPSASAPPHRLEAAFSTCLAPDAQVHWAPAGVRYSARAQTPSFVGGPAHGWDSLLESMLAALKPADLPIAGTHRLNLIVGFEQLPENYRQLEQLFKAFEVPIQILSDARAVLEGTTTPPVNSAGTTLEALRSAPGAPDTLLVRPWQLPRSRALIAERWGHGLPELPMPLGIAGTDAWVEHLVRRTGRAVPEPLAKARLALMTAIERARPLLTGQRVALFGEPDFVTAMGRYLAELGTGPAIVLCQNGDRRWQQAMRTQLDQAGCAEPVPLLYGRDLADAKARIEQSGARLLIVPPGRDRADPWQDSLGNLHRIHLQPPAPLHGAATLGYGGAAHILDRILDALTTDPPPA